MVVPLGAMEGVMPLVYYCIVNSTGDAYIGNRRGEPLFDGYAFNPHARCWRSKASAERARDALSNLCQEEMRLKEALI